MACAERTGPAPDRLGLKCYLAWGGNQGGGVGGGGEHRVLNNREFNRQYNRQFNRQLQKYGILKNDISNYFKNGII